MAIKKFNPTTPSRRTMTVSRTNDLTDKKPEKALTEPLRKKAGRNNQGRITVRHKGGGAKRQYRIIDFKRDKHEIPAKIAAIEYDPNRSARIALLHYKDGMKRYILAPLNLNVGDTVEAGPNADIKVGNSLPLRNIPTGTVVHNIELQPGKGGVLARSAGCGAQLMAKEGRYATLRMPSSEVRMVLIECYATIGRLGNIDHENLTIGKAGRSRWMGIRPSVRGVAMNPRDHPHGGGEGKSPVGRKTPVTKWGKPALGRKTRHNKRTEKYIVSHRKPNK